MYNTAATKAQGFEDKADALRATYDAAAAKIASTNAWGKAVRTIGAATGLLGGFYAGISAWKNRKSGRCFRAE